MHTQTTYDLVNDVIELLSDRSRWCKGHFAMNNRGFPVDYDHPAAVRYCVMGAFLRSKKSLENETVAELLGLGYMFGVMGEVLPAIATANGWESPDNDATWVHLVILNNSGSHQELMAVLHNTRIYLETQLALEAVTALDTVPVLVV